MAEEKQADPILVPDFVTVRELAELVDLSPIEVMKALIGNGIMASINQQIDFDTAAIVAEEMGFSVQSESAVQAEEEERQRAEEALKKWDHLYADEAEENLVERPPIVTILGHVDHGKTTLLDAIRQANVADGEAGGITQHIGAYRVQHDGRTITFLDTPGHEAFTAMRARGAHGADIGILVVAADDGVMPTTREALTHVKAANLPIVVAITKIDMRGAQPEVVKQQLSEVGLVPDDWDGDTLMVPVAAPDGVGLDDLLEAILLVADETPIHANPEGTTRGTVVEAQVEKQRGTVATLLVMNGTLKQGDVVMAGTSYGRVKAMQDEAGNAVKEASPSTPVSVLGLNESPEPGETFEVVQNEKIARGLAEELQVERTAAQNVTAPAFTLEDLFAQVQAGEAKELTMILRADVQGSIQPILDSLELLGQQNEEGIQVRVLAADVGNISENDVTLASTTGAIVVGFNVGVENAATKAAEVHKVDIRHYKIIYKLLEDIELALNGMLEPKYEAKVIGKAEVRQLFRVPKLGYIAGSYITDGEARRNAKARVRRGKDVVVDETDVSSLKRFEDDVREVRTGFECGIGLKGFSDFEEGDVIEFFVMERV